MKVTQIVGADLSKKTVDFAHHSSGRHLKIENNSVGFNRLRKWLKELKVELPDLMIVLEHTGAYSYRLEQFLHSQQIRFSKVSGLAIKRSLGIVRGKSDKQDAIKIARYGFEKMESLKPTQALTETMQNLKLLNAARERLVSLRSSLQTPLKDLKDIYELPNDHVIINSHQQIIQTLNDQIKELDKSIEKTLVLDEAIYNNYQLITSVKGVGKVLGVAVIVKTENFTKFTDSRKFACFCGTVPFENTSGTSLRKKSHTSHLADKRMKTLLDLAAKSAIQYDKELKEYYVRRTSEGLAKMSVINAVRTKLIYRIFAVVKRQTPYQPLPLAA